MTTRYRPTRRSVPRARWMDLRYPGTCTQCGVTLPKGSRAFYDPSDRSLCCTDLACAHVHGVTTQEWCGSPISGRYVEVLSEHRMSRQPLVRDPGEDAADRWNEGQ